MLTVSLALIHVSWQITYKLSLNDIIIFCTLLHRVNQTPELAKDPSSQDAEMRALTAATCS